MTKLTVVRDPIEPDPIEPDPIGYLLDKYEAAGGGRDGIAAVYEFLRLAAFHLLDLAREESA